MTRIVLSFFLAGAAALAVWPLAESDTPASVECAAPDVEMATVSYQDHVQSIFDFNCVVCHQTGAANGGLNLEFGISHEQLVGVESTQSELPLVEPGSAEESYLYHKLAGTHLEVGGSGASMPLGGPPLPDDDIERIVTWIQECALDN